MGKEALKVLGIKLGILLSTAAVVLAFSKFDFPKIDALFRDLLQLTNKTKIQSNIRTLNIDTSNPKFARPISLLALKNLVEEISAGSPQSIVILLEPSEIKD